MDVSDLAKVIGYEVDSLLEAINQAGLSQSSANDNISTEDRKKILEHIKSTKKGSKKTISIAKKTKTSDGILLEKQRIPKGVVLDNRGIPQEFC